jgi:hypothetical protein
MSDLLEAIKEIERKRSEWEESKKVWVTRLTDWERDIHDEDFRIRDEMMNRFMDLSVWVEISILSGMGKVNCHHPILFPKGRILSSGSIYLASDTSEIAVLPISVDSVTFRSVGFRTRTREFLTVSVEEALKLEKENKEETWKTIPSLL